MDVLCVVVPEPVCEELTVGAPLIVCVADGVWFWEAVLVPVDDSEELDTCEGLLVELCVWVTLGVGTCEPLAVVEGLAPWLEETLGVTLGVRVTVRT